MCLLVGNEIKKKWKLVYNKRTMKKNRHSKKLHNWLNKSMYHKCVHWNWQRLTNRSPRRWKYIHIYKKRRKSWIFIFVLSFFSHTRTHIDREREREFTPFTDFCLFASANHPIHANSSSFVLSFSSTCTWVSIRWIGEYSIPIRTYISTNVQSIIVIYKMQIHRSDSSFSLSFELLPATFLLLKYVKKRSELSFNWKSHENTRICRCHRME